MGLRVVQVPQPAAGADWQTIVPGQYIYNVVGVTAQLATPVNPTTALDLSGNSFNATYDPARTQAIFGVPGPFGGGGGLAVDMGIDPPTAKLASATNSGAFDTADFTVEALVNVPSQGFFAFQRLFAMGSQAAPGYRFQVGIQLSAPNGSLQGLDAFGTVFGLASSFSANAWHHVAVTQTGGTWIGYVDGVAAAPVAGHPIGAPTNRLVCLGGDQVNTQGNQGKVASWAYWGSVLTGAQIAAHSAAVATSAAAYQTAVLADTPLALWMLNQTITRTTRTVALRITDGTNTVGSFPAPFPTVTVPGTITYSWQTTLNSSAQTPNGATTTVAIPRLILPAGYTIGTSTLDLVATDQWSNINVWWNDNVMTGQLPVSPYEYPPGALLKFVQRTG